MTRGQRLASAAFLLALGWQTVTSAYSAAFARMPPTAGGQIATTASPITGLRLVVEGGWHDRAGYRPIRFLFLKPGGAATRDQPIRVTLFTSGGPGSQPSLAVSGSTVLPEGEDKSQLLLMTPQVGDMINTWWEVEVDGKPDPALSRRKSQPLGLNQRNSNRRDLQVVCPTIETSSVFVSVAQRYGLRTEESVFSWSEANCESFGKWIGYSSADVVRLTLDQLRHLSTKSPDRVTAIRYWVLGGGALWIEQTRNDVGALAEIDQLLGTEGWVLLSGKQAVPEPIEGAPAWKHENLKRKTNNTGDTIQGLIEDAGAVLTDALNIKTSRRWYARRDVGLGTVLAFQGLAGSPPRSIDNDARNAARENWRERSVRYRVGATPGEGTEDFANLLIPGIGLAPVGAFQLIITLFVLGIGPLNYWLLRRRGQLHLFALTTPVAAALLTLGMFVYALVGDGFGVSVRVRSVTLINQSDREAVSWSRLSHYAAVAPESGLVFPDDTLIIPIEPGWESAIAQREEATRKVVWQEGEQRLVSGWLPTRTAVQHMAIRTRESDNRLLFSSSSGTSSLQVLNRLGADVDLLFVLDESGAWKRGQEIPAGESAQLEASDKDSALAELRLLLLDNEPVMPLGSGEAVEDALMALGDRQARRIREQGVGDTRLDDNLMNRFLDRLIGIDGTAPLELPNQSYVAITSTAVETPLGVEDAEEVDSFHVVVGRWAEP